MTVTPVPAAAEALVSRLFGAYLRTPSEAQKARLDRMIAAALKLAKPAA